MQRLLSKVSIHVNESIYLKDPESSDLGKRIIAGGIDLIDRIGFEQFTFRKLAREINSTEASIYRYFDSKHKLLLYLTAWHWGWMEYRLVFSVANIKSAAERLEIAIRILTERIEEDHSFSHINNLKLYQIVISESSKAYLTKEVDHENKEGFFSGYNQILVRVIYSILEIEPEFKYPHMLISTVIEGAHHQRFFAEHLPRLTDVIKGEDAVTSFCRDMVFSTLNKRA